MACRNDRVLSCSHGGREHRHRHRVQVWRCYNNRRDRMRTGAGETIPEYSCGHASAMVGLDRRGPADGSRGSQTFGGRGSPASMGAVSKCRTRSSTSATVCVGAALQPVHSKHQPSQRPRVTSATAPQCGCQEVGTAVPPPLGPCLGTIASAGYAHSRHYASQGGAVFLTVFPQK